MHFLNKFFLLFLFLLSSCSSPTLSVQTEYWNRNDLASVHIRTPDPEKDSQEFGQHIYIYWTLPSRTDMSLASLQIKVRLKNGELQEKTVPLSAHRGVYCYPIIGDDFTKKGGLLSYFIELISNGTQTAVCKHTFWVEEIQTPQGTKLDLGKFNS